MSIEQRTALYRDEDHEFLGYIKQETVGWQAQTIFGYTIARTEQREEAVQLLHERGLTFLMGVWQYFDKDEKEWFPCVIKEAYPHRVVVIRTNVMGYQEPDSYKLVTLAKPTEDMLVKS